MRRLFIPILAFIGIHTSLASQQLDIETAWNRICSCSPRIASASLEIDALDGDKCQASLYPNPIFGVQVDSIFGSSFYEGCDAAELILSVSQPIVTGGKLQKRTEIADALIAQAEWELESVKLELREQLEQQFITLAILQERLHNASKGKKLACSVLEATTHLIECGKSTAYQERKASIALRYTDIELNKIQMQIQSVRQDLVQLWGSCEADFDSVCYPIHHLAPPPCLADLCCLLDQSPQALLAEAAYCAAERGLTAARADVYPDVLFSLGYKNYRECGDYSYFVQLNVPLPIFDQNEGNIKRAKALRYKAEVDRAGIISQACAELKNALAQANSAYLRAKSIKEGLLKDLEEAHAWTVEGYQQGKLAYIDLLDAQRSLFSSNEDYYNALQEYHLSMAAIRRITGSKLCLTN